MRLVLVDPEPPNPNGGGIRTYYQLLLKILNAKHIPCKIYTHNPQAYSGENAFIIQRAPFLNRPFRGFIYRCFPTANIFFEHSNWLRAELENHHTRDTVYEFADFLGYGFFAIRKKNLRARINLRIHTPHFLVTTEKTGLLNSVEKLFNNFRENYCLKHAEHISAPSKEFVFEKLPQLKNWKYLPNPVPEIFSKSNSLAKFENQKINFLYLGRIEIRKGVLPMLKAFINFSKRNSHATLTLIGSKAPDTYCEQLDALVNSQSKELKSRIKFEPHDPKSNKSELFNRFEFLIVPSLWENSPYVYFEGMAAGLICIGSATGQMKVVAQATGAPLVNPGVEKEWEEQFAKLENLNRQPIIESQFNYLSEQQGKIPTATENYFLEIISK